MGPGVGVPEPLSPLSLGCDAGWGEWSIAAPGTKLQTAGFGRSDGLVTPAAWLLSGSLRYCRKELQKVGGRRGMRFAVVCVGGSEVSLEVHGSGFALMQQRREKQKINVGGGITQGKSKGIKKRSP